MNDNTKEIHKGKKTMNDGGLIIGILIAFIIGCKIGVLISNYRALVRPWSYCTDCPEWKVSHSWGIWHKRYDPKY